MRKTELRPPLPVSRIVHPRVLGLGAVLAAAAAAPAGATSLAVPAAPAKLALERATIDRSAKVIDVRAPISARASGTATLELEAAGRTSRWTAKVAAGHILSRHAIPAAQAAKGTGILTIRYPGDADTLPQTVRLRAANGFAELDAERPTLSGGRLRADGTIARRATGRIRIELLFLSGGQATTISRSMPIAKGAWRLDATLTAAERQTLDTRAGTVQASVLYTGDGPHRIRGEMRSFEVLGAPPPGTETGVSTGTPVPAPPTPPTPPAPQFGVNLASFPGNAGGLMQTGFPTALNLDRLDMSKVQFANGLLQLTTSNDTNFSHTNALGVIISAQAKFRVQSRLIGPFTAIDAASEQQGIYWGPDSGSFIKPEIESGAHGGNGPMQRVMTLWMQDTTTGQGEILNCTNALDPKTCGVPVPGNNASTIDLRLDVDPATRTVVATYSLDGGPFLNFMQNALPQAITIPARWFNPQTKAGVINSNQDALAGGQPFVATYGSFATTLL